MDKRPIGIFDSGIGGLTVVREIIRALPNESLIYLGDTARVPYGPRNKTIIKKFALQLAKYLLKRDIKALVVACNTVSATALADIEKISNVPVIGVIKPTVKASLDGNNTTKIGVIGTRATIKSGIYEKEIAILNKKAEVTSASCPLFVPLVEEGLLEHAATDLIAKEYLSEIKEKDVRKLILGCTHYPLLIATIKKHMGNVEIVDSARPTAIALKELLLQKGLLNKSKERFYKFLVTDDPEQVQRTTQIFFSNKFPGVLEKVTL